VGVPSLANEVAARRVMKIDDVLYFAPGLPFSDVDFDGPRLPSQFEARIIGFYLDPADSCIEMKFAFAAGVLLTTCIDALSRSETGSPDVKMRFTSFCRSHLPSLGGETIAERFYCEFRNGLVHEARIKKGAQFSFDFDETANQTDGVLIINPAGLTREVREALGAFTQRLKRDPAQLKQFAARLKADHTEEV
jgi:hypothetical protein